MSSAAVASQTLLRRPQMAISAPSPRNRSAIALPSPVPPPVTRIFLPANRPSTNMGASSVGRRLATRLGSGARPCRLARSTRIGRIGKERTLLSCARWTIAPAVAYSDIEDGETLMTSVRPLAERDLPQAQKIVRLRLRD